MDKAKREDAPIRIYEASSHILIRLSAVLFGVLAVVNIVVAISFNILVFMLPTLVLILAFLLAFGKMAVNSRRYILIYPDGIEYRIGKSSGFTEWENLRRFELRPTGKVALGGIVTRMPIPYRDYQTALERFYYPLPFYRDFIPLDEFLNLSRNAYSETVNAAVLLKESLGRDLMDYAPQLFEYSKMFEYGKEKAKNG